MESPDARYIPSLLDETQADALLKHLNQHVVWDERMSARRTASFGLPYNYSGMSYQAQPFPAPLSALIDALTPHTGFVANNCLINYYANGLSRMGFHCDEVEGLAPGTGVAIVSLGVMRELAFRRMDSKEIQWRYRLEHGSLFVMSAQTQAHFKHGILPDPKQPKARMSLTFRAILTPSG